MFHLLVLYDHTSRKNIVLILMLLAQGIKVVGSQPNTIIASRSSTWELNLVIFLKKGLYKHEDHLQLEIEKTSKTLLHFHRTFQLRGLRPEYHAAKYMGHYF